MDEPIIIVSCKRCNNELEATNTTVFETPIFINVKPCLYCEHGHKLDLNGKLLSGSPWWGN